MEELVGPTLSPSVTQYRCPNPHSKEEVRKVGEDVPGYESGNEPETAKGSSERGSRKGVHVGNTARRAEHPIYIHQQNPLKLA